MVSRHWQRAWSALIVVVFALLLCVPWSTWLGTRVNLADALALPSQRHPLGTDSLGRDLVVRAAEAVLGAVLPLWLGVLVATIVGVVLGIGVICLGTSRLWRPLIASFDAVVVVVVSVPVCLTAFAWAALSEHAGLIPVLFSLAVVFMLRTYLQVRDLYRKDEALAYWTAHAALGGSLLFRLLGYGIQTGWRRTLAMSLGFHLRTAVAIEASLSYLGFGIQEPSASFGNMLAAHFDLFLKGQWYVLVVLIVCLAMTAALPTALLILCAAGPIDATFASEVKELLCGQNNIVAEIFD